MRVRAQALVFRMRVRARVGVRAAVRVRVSTMQHIQNYIKFYKILR